VRGQMAMNSPTGKDELHSDLQGGPSTR